MTRFLHTSDWQLGMTRAFLDEGVQERYTHDRFDRIRRIGDIARAEDCRFVVVCGDVFESNQVTRKTVGRALEALRSVPVPVYLLPGNHDPLDDASVFASSVFLAGKPDNVHVLADDRPVVVGDGVELVAAPWPAKRLAANPLHDVLDRLQPAETTLRVCLAHGAVDCLADFADSAAVLSYEAMRQAIRDRKVHYIALGDKHSNTRVDPDGRIWYSGTPEATDFREPEPGFVNVVSLGVDNVETKRVRTGEWNFTELSEDSLSGPDDVARLLADISAMPDKERRVLRLTLSGILGLRDIDELDRGLDCLRELFASFETRADGLHSSVGDGDFDPDVVTGFAAAAAAELKKTADAGGDEAKTARDALLLLMRLGKTE